MASNTTSPDGPIDQQDDSMVDPLLTRSITKPLSPGFESISEIDNPLSKGNSPSKQNTPKPVGGPKRKENWTSLVEIAKLGRFEAQRTRKVSLRARLSALREDLEEDEAAARNKVRDSKSRQWVLELLSRDVVLWWEKGDRSKSLRAACLLTGALASKDDAIDYAKEWIMVTTALNKLHSLLLNHLKLQSEEGEEGEDDAVRWNWYYKISGIHGLVPRLYLQAAAWDLVGPPGADEQDRLYTQSMGISDPLVRQYYTAYLLSRALIRDLGAVAKDALQSVRHPCTAIEMLLPLSLTLTQCVGESTNNSSFPRLVGYAKTPVALQALLKVAEPETVSATAIDVLKSIESFKVGEATLIGILADKLLLSNPPQDEQSAKAIMNTAWLILNNVESQDAEGAITACAKFLELCCARYGGKEIFTLIRDLERRIRESGGPKHNPAVMRACLGLCARVESDPAKFSPLVSSEAFGRLFESLASSYDDSSFAHSSPKTDLAKRLLKLFLKPESKIDLSVAVEWAKTLNDSLHILSFDDERRQIDDLIKRFVEKACVLAAKMPFEARFTILADLRGRFYNSRSALKVLVSAVALLARESNMKKRDLSASCLAFCHATIPSILNPVERGLFYAHTAVLAISLGRLPQGDGLFKASVQCVADSVEEPDARAVELVRTIAASLVVAPGHPHPFYLVRGLANAVARRPSWNDGKPYIAILRLVEALTRLKLPYRVSGADSNDVLYGDDATMYSNEALAIGSLQETKIHTTGECKNEVVECAALMQRIRENIRDRSRQVASNTSRE